MCIIAGGSKKVKSKKLFSDRRFTVDKNGKLRIGGKFASARQVASYKAARTRRGLDTGLPTPSVSKSRRSRVTGKKKDAPKKAAATRKLNAVGAKRLGERVTPKADYFKVDYELPDTDAETIKAVLQRELIGRPLIFANGFVRGEDRQTFIEFDTQDGRITGIIGTPFRGVRLSNVDEAAAKMSEDFTQILARYNIVTVTFVGLTVSLPRESGG